MELIRFEFDRDFSRLQTFFKNNEPYSDFSPVSILCWSHKKEVFFRLDNNYLIIKIPTYLQDSYSYSVYVTGQNPYLKDKLFNSKEVFMYVPEISLPFLSYAKATEDRDSFDYIYNLSDLSNLNSSPMTAIRKKIKKFERFNSDVHSKFIDLSDDATALQILSLTQLWCTQKGFTEQETEDEFNAIKEYISLSKYIDDASIGVYNNTGLVAFTLNEILNDTWSMGHFGKALHGTVNLSLASEVLTARLLHGRGVKFLNHQQDTGIASLRDFKEHLVPATYLKKYFVKFK